MTAYLCLRCNCIHGWGEHPLVKKVEKHQRLAWEDIWWCPGCNRQNRTWDGSMMGQSDKMYKEVDVENLSHQVAMCGRDGHVEVRWVTKKGEYVDPDEIQRVQL